jgi:hypothetical protein
MIVINNAVICGEEEKLLVIDRCWVSSLSGPVLIRVFSCRAVVERADKAISFKVNNLNPAILTQRASASIEDPSGLLLLLAYQMQNSLARQPVFAEPVLGVRVVHGA